MANCKFEKQQYRYSNDNGVTWYNVIPERFEAGNLIEYDSADCSSIDTIYKWTLLEGEYICEDNVKYKKEIRYDSYDGGSTWYVSNPLVYRAGERIGIDEEFCSYKYEGHYIDDSGEDFRCPKGYKWNGVRCVAIDPIKVVKCDNNTVLSSGDTKYYVNDYKVTSATIGDCVSTISAETFDGCDGLTNVFIPNSVTSIGNYAFRDCSGLTSVTIPDSVRSIDYQAFGYCSGLRSATIGSGVTTISDLLFSYCTSLTSCTIGNSVRTIDYGSFIRCSSLTSINIPSGVTTIGDNAFEECSSLTSIAIPNSVTSIGGEAFKYCSGLTNVTIGNGVTSIGDWAFRYCTSLTGITINAATPPTLGSGVFENTNNCPIYVPSNSLNAYLSNWRRYSSRITSNLRFKATYSDGRTYSSGCDSDTILSEEEVRPSGYEYSSMTTAEIGNCITTIGDNAFEECSSLTSITIPSGITTIGDSAFMYCSSLTGITIPSRVTSISYGAFYACTSLSSIIIPDSVTSIGDWAFASCSSLTSITIPSGVTSIGQQTFFRCSGLTSVYIPDSVTNIGLASFNSCSSLTSIAITAITPPALGNSAFNNTNNCPIYVPCNSLNAYKTASGWSEYADRIREIPGSC